MKKVISLLLAAVLLVAWMVFPAAAAEPVQVTVSDGSAKQGELVSVSVSVSETVCATWLMTVVYDVEALELVSFQSDDTGIFSEVSTGKISRLGWVDAAVSGTLFTVTFRVLAEAGSHTVGVRVENITMADTTKLASTVKAGTVTVTAADTPAEKETMGSTQPPVETVPQPSGTVPEETATDAAGAVTEDVTAEPPAETPTEPAAVPDETVPDETVPGAAEPPVPWFWLLAAVCAIGAVVAVVCLRKKRNT